MRNNSLKFIERPFPTIGTKFVDCTLEGVLMHCYKELPKSGKKGQYGSVFVYEADALGIHPEDETSTGVMLIDFDHLTKQQCEIIYQGFNLLVESFPSLIAIQYSSGYYIKKDEGGLHIYVKTKKLDKHTYKQLGQICYAIIAQLIERLLNINICKLNNDRTKKDLQPIMDLHSTSLYQRFNLFYSTFKYNEDSEEFNLDIIKFDDLNKLVNKFNLKLSSDIDPNIKTFSPTLNGCIYNEEINKIKIDRHFRIGKYSGNDIRFRISIIADLIFGKGAKEFCDKYFYYDKNKSIYTFYNNDNKYIDILIYKWLKDNNYIKESNRNIIKNWISEYEYDIKKFIKNNYKCEIEAPTGSGKTTFINTDLAHYFNAVVIVPYNVTNKLYDNLFEVNSNYCGSIPKNKPIVMVWDQAVKHWEEIKDRQIIVDEAHTLFFDRTYRDAAIKLVLKLKEEFVKVAFITATPAGEVELFGLKTLKYYKKRDVITLKIKATKNIEWAQYNYIKKAIDNNWYDKIILLDDLTAKKIYEQFTINCYDVSYIRSDTKETNDFKYLREKELLNKKITICTCIAFNGLNFKNENEKILVVGSIQLGQTTSCEIIQQIGRIRKSNVTGIYFYDPEKSYIEDIEHKKIKAQEYNSIYVDGGPDTFLSYDRKYLNNDFIIAKQNIQDYQITHSTINNIISELSTAGYIKGTLEDNLKDEDVVKMNLALKRKESDEIKNDINDESILVKEYDEDYKKQWAKDINYIISNPRYSGITIRSFKNMITNEHKNKLVETMINEIKEIIRIIQVDDNEWNNFKSKINLYESKLSNPIDKKQFRSNFKHINKIRDKYVGLVVFNNGCINLSNIVGDIIQFEEDRQKETIKNNKKGGKKTKKIKDMKTGIIYNSVSDCANAIQHNITYISKHKDRFISI